MAQPHIGEQRPGLPGNSFNDLLFDPNSAFEELVPVDEFFNQYVNELELVGPQGLQQVSQHAGPHQAGAFHQFPQGESPHSGNYVTESDSSGLLSAGQDSMNPGRQSSGLYQQSSVSQPQMPALPPQQLPTNLMPGLQQQPLFNNGGYHQPQYLDPQLQAQLPYGQMASPMLGGGPQTRLVMAQQSSGEQPLAGVAPVDSFTEYEQYQQQQQQQQQGAYGLQPQSSYPRQTGSSGEGNSDDMDMEEHGTGDGKSSRSRRHRTPRQQMLNKQAQQRYRERKKAKAVQLETAVQALSAKVDDLSVVQRENQALADKNQVLERSLLEKEAELNRIRTETSRSMRHSASGKSMQTGLDSEKELEELGDRYHTTVAELKEVLKQNGLEKPSAAAEGAPPEAVKRLATLVETITNVCARAIRLEGVDMWELIAANIDKSSGAGDNTRRWIEAAKLLRFNKEQIEKVLFVRGEHLKKLGRIFQDRQNLNLEAISVLLPKGSGGNAPNLINGKMGCFSLMGFFGRAKHGAKISAVLDRLKENLREEQRAASELDYIVFRRILTPLQGAWFICYKYPAYCDSLALCNGVAEIAGPMPGADVKPDMPGMQL